MKKTENVNVFDFFITNLHYADALLDLTSLLQIAGDFFPYKWT